MLITRRLTSILPALLPLIASCICGQAQTDDLKALQALFDGDPAAGLAQAATMFEAATRRADLDAMVGVARTVHGFDQSMAYGCFPLLDGMAEAAIPVAERAGKWEALGDLCTYRMPVSLYAQGAFDAPTAPGAALGLWRAANYVRFAHLAEAAYAKAGKPGFRPPSYPVTGEVLDARLEAVRAGAAKFRLENSGESWTRRLAAIDDAEGRGATADAAAAALALAADLSTERNDWFWSRTLPQLVGYSTVTGGEPLVAAIRAEVERGRAAGRQYWCDPTGASLEAWSAAWAGGDDAFLRGCYWCVSTEYQGGALDSEALAVFYMRLRRFHRETEARQLVRLLVAWQSQPDHARAGSYPASLFVTAGLDAYSRRVLTEATCRGFETTEVSSPWYGVGDLVTRLLTVASAAPADQRVAWARDTAQALADTAPRLPKPAQQVEGLEGAARLYDQGQSKDLAQQCRDLAKALLGNSPAALLGCALYTAQSAAAEGRWEDALKALEPACGRQAPSRQLLQATLLMQQAYRGTGKASQAEDALDRAWKLLEQVGIAPAERANDAIAMAAGTDDTSRKLFFLRAAQRAATAPGLEFMQESIATQLGDAALASDNLVAAEKALTEVVDRSEAKRERLAFDPQLREQWFADNIGPYRKLMRVAALRQDVVLALSIGERMRSRALLDQLAWQKTDLALRLPDDLRDRLLALRASRQKVYGLLQGAVTGGETAAAAGAAPADDPGKPGPVRGYYMPVRGVYMPIRGPLDAGKVEQAPDAGGLKELLAKLAADEFALESAIRQAVPAYAAAAARPASGAALERAVAQQDDVALLHYTLCDDGLVVVALGPGKAPKVALIAAKGEELWQRIGRFRQAVWERTPDALTQAAELHETLVAPVLDTISNAKRLWVVGDGALQLVPFGALMGADQVFLASKMAVVNVPSLSLALSPRGARAEATKALIVAAPDTGAVLPPPENATDGAALPTADRGRYMPIRGMYMPVRGSYMPVRGEGQVSSALTAMALVPLPGARAEGQAISEQLPGATLLTAKDATKARLLKEGADAGVLHIATHGYADPDFPDFSGVLLAGTDAGHPYDVLTAQEVYLWPLRASLVTLSACQTGLGKDMQGEGLLGLTRAFIYAGARDVLCSLWPVSDDSTAKLMASFYAARAKGPPVELALQQAQQALIADPATRHPFFWAGFIAVRGPQ